MNRLIKILLPTILILLVSVRPGLAQTLATTTTLAADMTATATVMTVTSGTGFTAGNFVWADSEKMLIRSVNSTAITVQRGVDGTGARAHDNAERVLTGADDFFHANDPDYGQDCTRGSGQAAFLPWINVRTGTLFACPTTAGTTGSTGSWAATNTAPVTYNSIPTSF